LDLYCTGDDAFMGVLEGVTVEWFEQRYERYIVFDDVQMEVFADSPWVLSLQGPSAGGILKTLGLPVPPEDHGHAVISAQAGPGEVRICRKDRTGVGGFDLLLPDEAVCPTWAALCHAGAVPMGSEGMDTARIVAGRAQWPTDGTDKSLVHELRIDGEVCNFNKGCYLGQEVINRIDVKGQVAKRLTGLVLEEDALPPVGAEVMLNDAVVGRVSSATRHEGRVVALAVLRRAAWDPDHQVQIAAGERSVAAKTADLPFEC
jgi:folate-binding protein YgfZ